MQRFTPEPKDRRCNPKFTLRFLPARAGKCPEMGGNARAKGDKKGDRKSSLPRKALISIQKPKKNGAARED